VVDDALRVRQFIGRLLPHPGGKARQIVLRQPDRHGEVFVRRAELELQVLVQTLEKILRHVVRRPME
jgi:hypothetical protein